MGIKSLLFKVVILQTYTCDVVYMYYMMFIHYDGKLFLSDVFSVHPRFANHYDIGLFLHFIKDNKEKEKKTIFFMYLLCKTIKQFTMIKVDGKVMLHLILCKLQNWKSMSN